MTGLLKKWGLGVELVFEAGKAVVKMGQVNTALIQTKEQAGRLGGAIQGLGGHLASLGLVLTPIATGFGLIIGKGSQMAADLEAQMLTMRVMLGSATKANELIGMIRKEAALTPFSESDLIEGSKRLLGLSGDNVKRNMELLKVMETMAALNPGKSVVDAVEGLKDAASGGGFERLKEFQMSFKAEDFAKYGRPGGKAWADAVFEAMKAEMTRLTKGEDIVKALSQTFSGRLSTLQDSIANIMREIGMVFNKEVGSHFDMLSDRVAELTPLVQNATRNVAAQINQLMDRIEPRLMALDAMWKSLGKDGQTQLIQGVLAFAAFATALIPIGGILGGVGFAVSSVISVIASLWEVFAAGFGVISSLFLPEIVLPILGGLAMLAAGFALLFAVFGEEGEGPLQFFMRLAGYVGDVLVGAFNQAVMAGTALWEGFKLGFAGMGPLLDQVSGPLEQLVAKFSELWYLFAGSSSVIPLRPFVMLGFVLGNIANVLIWGVGVGIAQTIRLVDGLVAVFGPFVVLVIRLLDLFSQWMAGTISIGDAMDQMGMALLSAVKAVFIGLLSIVLLAVELLFRGVFAMLAMLPVVGDWIAANGGGLTDGLANMRNSLFEGITTEIAGIDLAKSAKDKEAAAAKSPTVNVTSGEVKVDATVTATTNLDGKEVARSTDKVAAVNAQKQGRDLPATSRGKVLRAGGTLGALAPAEVW